MLSLHPSNKMGPNRGSHLPVLIKLVHMTDGPIIELGCGMYSTPFLHWACRPHGRLLTTYENNPEWFRFVKQFERDDYHKVVLVDNWDDIELEKEVFSECPPCNHLF